MKFYCLIIVLSNSASNCKYCNLYCFLFLADSKINDELSPMDMSIPMMQY